MGPRRFSIILDITPTGAYLAGQVISGRVNLILEKEENTQGEAEVGWQEHQGQGTSRGYHSNESYFLKTIFLVGDGNSDVIIPSGDHHYPFRFQLPKNLPSSFEGDLGNLRYSMNAEVIRSWKLDFSTKTIFKVDALVDLNLQPAYMEPLEVSKEKSICCLCFKEGPISMKVGLPRKGFVPGQYAEFSVYINNSSSRPISEIIVYFIKEISYHAKGRTKRCPEEEQVMSGPGVEAFQCEEWKSQFQIPQVIPSDLGGCHIIGAKYFLKFQLDIPSSIDLKTKVPIFVGTIPYTDLEEQSLPQSLLVTEDGKQSISFPPLDPPIASMRMSVIF